MKEGDKEYEAYYSISSLKARLYATLLELEKVLYDRYPHRKNELEMWFRKIKVKLDRLKVFTLYDYMRTIEAAASEFPEFMSLMPDKKFVMGVTERWVEK